jgi:hypothetical protein
VARSFFSTPAAGVFGPYVESGRAGHHSWWAAASAALAIDNPNAPETVTNLAETVEQQLAVAIARDVYATLPLAEREEVHELIASEWGPTWRLISRDPSVAVNQNALASDLIHAMSSRGLLPPDLAADLRITASNLEARANTEVEPNLAGHQLPGGDDYVERSSLRARLQRQTPAEPLRWLGGSVGEGGHEPFGPGRSR